jgi:hypothetical protein
MRSTARAPSVDSGAWWAITPLCVTNGTPCRRSHAEEALEWLAELGIEPAEKS